MAQKKEKVKKADSLSSQQIHNIIDNVFWKYGKNIPTGKKLVDWRTTLKIFTMYKTFCRWDCYSKLTIEKVSIGQEAVTLSFSSAKTDQVSKHCRNVIFHQFFSIFFVVCFIPGPSLYLQQYQAHPTAKN